MRKREKPKAITKRINKNEVQYPFIVGVPRREIF
jgi:hypothetical protein